MASREPAGRSAIVTDEQLAGEIMSTIRTVFKQPDIAFQPERELRDIFGLDSVQFVQLILAVEEQFGITLNEDEVDGMERIGDLYDVVRRKVATLA
jgi:acyl carrier protein